MKDVKMSIKNAMTVQANLNSVQINEVSLAKGVLLKHYQYLLKDATCWHKFLVSNTDGLSRNEILKAIVDHVNPLDLIPVYYAKDPTNSYSYFLARNCESAIEKLYKDNLVVNHPYNKNLASQNFEPFKLRIILNFASSNEVELDVQQSASAVVSKRYLTGKTLNLDRFHEDPELTEFCPLAQPKIMYFILHIGKTLEPEEVILSNNGIKLLNPLEALVGLNLQRLDLSNNELASLNDLSPLKHFRLKELKLTGNPLCNCEEEVYISEIRQMCPTVQILDGVQVSMEVDMLPHFWTSFPMLNAHKTKKRVFFTTTPGVVLDPRRRGRRDARLIERLRNGLKSYSNISRNLKRAADFSRTSEYLFRDRENIMDVFATKLPPTEHDPYSFTADLMCMTDSYAVIVVTGVFHEKPTALLDKKRFVGFTRSFALQLLYDSNYVITNDQLHIYNGLTHQERNSFLEVVEPTEIVHKPLVPKPRADTDFIDLIATFSHLTNLKGEWSRKCLEECSYDLKASLELFVDLYKGDKIPDNGFIE